MPSKNCGSLVEYIRYSPLCQTFYNQINYPNKSHFAVGRLVKHAEILREAVHLEHIKLTIRLNDKRDPTVRLSKQYVFLVKTPCSLDRNMVMIEIYENYIPRIVISSHVVLQPANARKPRLILVDMSPWQIRNALRCILGWGPETVPSARSQIGRGMSPEKDLGSCLPQKLAVPQSRKLGIQKKCIAILDKGWMVFTCFYHKVRRTGKIPANWNGALRKLTQIWACHPSQQPIDRPLLTGILLELQPIL